MEQYANLAIELLQTLIPIRSYSYEEAERADFIVKWLAGQGVEAHRIGNNIWAKQVPRTSSAMRPVSRSPGS